MKKIYKNWHQPDSIQRFASKEAGDFFRSETYFMEQIGSEINSVLDVGCASGRFIELIRQYSKDCHYTGIDLVPESIEIGRKIYTNADFHVASGLDYETDKHFDLVNATGVFQHEPDFQSLLKRMIHWSDKYVLFDIKVSSMKEHLVDITRAFCESENDRMYFNVLSWSLFHRQMLLLEDIESVTVFGYETKPNKVTRVPETILPFASVGVLLKKGKGAPVFTVAGIPYFLK